LTVTAPAIASRSWPWKATRIESLPAPLLSVSGVVASVELIVCVLAAVVAVPALIVMPSTAS
jgi:hypothetical protein